jgi:hypothetical protein
MRITSKQCDLAGRTSAAVAAVLDGAHGGRPITGGGHNPELNVLVE